MNINEIVDGIAGQFGKELNHVFKEQIRTNVLISRAEAIRQYVDKYGNIPNSVLSSINCIPTTNVDISECCSVDLECEVIRTVNQVPSSIRIRGLESTFTYVGAIDGKVSFSDIQSEELPYLLADRFLKKKIFYSYINGYIYIFNSKPKNIRVKGVFNNPYEIMKLNDCENNPAGCAGILDIPEDFISLIKSFVYSEMRGTPIENKQEEIKVIQQ